MSDKLNQMTVYGTLVQIKNVGVLFTGPSSVGKSESAIELVMSGYKFIADDVVLLKSENGKLIGLNIGREKPCYAIEIKGLWIIDILKLFGKDSVLTKSVILLEIELYFPKDNKIISGEYLGDVLNWKKYLDVDIIYYRIPVTPGRNISKISELIVLNYKCLISKGESYLSKINNEIINKNLKKKQ